MNHRKNIILLLFTGLIILIPLTVFAEGKNDMLYKFTKTDSTLSFYGSFTLNKSPACLLEIFINFNHIKAMESDAKEVQLIDQGSNWNRIRYVYQKFIFFKNISVWKRKLDIEKQRLDYTLESSEYNVATLPKMISFSGYYQVKNQGKDIIVEYYQYSQLAKSSITNIYLNIVKNEAINFMKKLMEYSNAKCSDKPMTGS